MLGMLGMFKGLLGMLTTVLLDPAGGMFCY